MANDRTNELVLAYYDSWKNGMASYDEKRLRSILASDLQFEGPIAGKGAARKRFFPDWPSLSRRSKPFVFSTRFTPETRHVSFTTAI